MRAEVLEWIESQKPALVQEAEEYVNEQRIFEPSDKNRGKRKPPPRVTSSQLRNALNVIHTEGSVKILINFLRYQIGRGNKGWADEKSGLALLDLLTNERSVPEAIDATDDERRKIQARLITLFLGYVIREYTFRSNAGTHTNA